MYIVERHSYGGIDWHDSCTKIVPIKINEQHLYASQSSAIQAVVQDVIALYPNFEVEIKHAFDTNQMFHSPLPLENGDDCEIFVEKDKVFYEREISINPETMSIQVSYYFGQYECITSYIVKEVVQPKYFVIENFLVPKKGIPSVERLYHQPFDTLEEAKNFLIQLKPHSGICKSEINIFCNDVDALNQKWFQLQMECIRLLKLKGVSIYDDKFDIFTEKHIENLK